jgi:DNA-binding SARP family transcriptional activator
VEFRILGPLEVVEGGVPLRVGAPKDRALLAVLLVRAGEVVSTDQAAEALWGAEPPRSASASIQNSVSKLRKRLGPERVVTKPPGYALQVEGDEIDAERARLLLERARAAGAQAGVELLRQARSLFRGPPLADFAYESFAQPAIAQLEELRLAIEDARIGYELELGRHVELIGELEALVAEHPLRESFRGHLMLALYRAGRQVDALGTYEQARQALAEELGIDPGLALRRLHSAILRQERSLDRPSAPATPDAHVGDVARALLAGQLVPVLGTELGELARRLAERFDLAPHQDAELVRIAQHVAVMQGSGPLHEELHELLAVPAEPTSVHRFFAALPPLLRERGLPHQLIVTTSYDLAVEQALLDAGEEFDVVSYLAAGRHRGKFCHFAPDGSARVIDVPNRYASELSLDRRTVVLKLHGGIDPAHERAWESFVITEDDYIDYLPYSDLARAVPVSLAVRLRRSHFLLLGYGVLDWNLRVVLNRLWGNEALDYRSWAVASDAQPIERALWRARDIELLEAPLEEYVDALALRVGLGVQAVP